MDTIPIEENEAKSKERKRRTAEGTLRFWKELHELGFPLSDKQVSELRANGLLSRDSKPNEPKKESDLIDDLDSFSNVIIDHNDRKNEYTREEHEEYKKKHQYRGRSIEKADWAPKSTVVHTAEFVHWINSINSGFSNISHYEPFELYCRQAFVWLTDPSDIRNFKYDEEKRRYAYNEINRCRENTLYYLDKYLKLKDGKDPNISFDDSIDDGQYESVPVHRVMCFMIDCGYSIIMGKPRQIAATTTLSGIAVAKVMFNRNTFVKFITMDKESGEEIFEDKMKYAYSQNPLWMHGTVSNDTENFFQLKKKSEKGKMEGANSKIRVVAPKVAAINGGSPTIVMVDEAGYIGILDKMIKEARPTLFRKNKQTGLLEMKRQILIWGCVCAGTKVYTNDGRVVNIEDLQQEDGILGYNGGGVSKEPIIGINPPAKKPCYRITTFGGNTIECSEDHPLMWSKRRYFKGKKQVVEFKKAMDVKRGDYLLMADEVPVFGKRQVNDARLLGLLVGDGNYSSNSRVTLTIDSLNIEDFVRQNYDTGFEKPHKKCITISINGGRSIVRSAGIFGQTKDRKRLPDNIHTYNKHSLAEFIGGYFDADGNVYYNKKKKTTRISLTSANKELLSEMKYQLLKFGIACIIVREKRNTLPSYEYRGQKDHIFRLYISKDEDIQRFKDNITFLSEHKQRTLNNFKRGNRNFGRPGKFLFNFQDDYPKGNYFKEKDYLKGMRYEGVSSVEYIGEKDIYNLNAGDTHTYLANGFVTHNTGGDMDAKAGPVYEEVFRNYLDAWNSGDYSTGIIPLFFDWTTRPGISKEFYKQEMEAYSSGGLETLEGKTYEERMAQFKQHYPSVIDDMFITSEKTLISGYTISQNLDRIKNQRKMVRPRWGRFEPVYDYDSPVDHSDVPYKIIGANFIPCDDNEAHNAPVCMIFTPKPEWRNRYFIGVDPIQSDNGLSKMAAVVWDKLYCTVPAFVNTRSDDHKETFLQCLLLSLFYNTDNHVGGQKQLIEMNFGTSYYDYCSFKGYEYGFVENSELPEIFRGGKTLPVGVDNHGQRSKFIITVMKDLFLKYGERLFISEMYRQARTFVCTVTERGTETWGTKDKTRYQDDLLFGYVFSYICGMCYDHLLPYSVKETNSAAIKKRYKLVRKDDGSLTRVFVSNRSR